MPENISEDILELRDSWPLTHIIPSMKNKLVVVVGAYKGKLMEHFALQEPKAVYGYEPQEWAASEALARLSPYINYSVQSYGLAVPPIKSASLGEWGTDACSMLTDERASGVGHFAEPIASLQSIINKREAVIDLCVINIEGYEFTLLEYLLTYPLFHNLVHSLAIQFHTKYSTPAQYAHVLSLLDKLYSHHFNYFLPSWGYWS